MTNSNSDRLRGLKRPGTPEERPTAPKPAPAQPSASTPASPAETSRPTASSPPPARSTPPSQRRWLPAVVAGAVVGLLVVGSLIAALALRGTEDEPASEATPESVTTPDTTTVVEPPTEPRPNDASVFDRPADVGGLIDMVTGSTVVIVCEPGDSLGSGFSFDLAPLTGTSERVVVTNHHVVVGCLDSQRVDVYQGEDYYPGEVLAWDQSADVAIVSVPGLGAPPLSPNLNPQVGQWVMAVGAPEGVENSASFGFITNILSTEPTITSDAVIAEGSSGGPLVDNQGRVVAVNYAVWEEATGISLSAPIEALCLRTVDCSE